MEKLTIEHLAPYLPYELKCYGASDIWTIVGIDEESIIIKNGIHKQTIWINELHINYSLLLRPLSDLTKEIEVNGKKFVPYDECTMEHTFYLTDDGKRFHTEEYNIKDKLIESDFIWLPFKIIQKLFEWHFDVFGLIEKNLAIDINTLKSQ